MTVRFERSRHSAKTIAPTRKVLPTWRGIDIPVPPTVAAYLPSERFAKIRRPTSGCHGRNVIPNSRHLLCTAGQPVETTPFGATTCRAISESFGAEGFVLDFAAGILSPLLSLSSLQRRDLLRMQRDLPVQCGLRRAVHVSQILDHLPPLSDQDLQVRARGDCLIQRQVLLGDPLRIVSGSNAQCWLLRHEDHLQKKSSGIEKT